MVVDPMLWPIVALLGAGIGLALFGFTQATTDALGVESSDDRQNEEGR